MTNPHSYKVTGWGAEFEFYSGLTLAQVADGFSEFESGESETLVGQVLVVSDEAEVHTASLDHPKPTFPSSGLVRPLTLKWLWELETEGEFDPKLLGFESSLLVYDGCEYEPDETAVKGEDEPYEV